MNKTKKIVYTKNPSGRSRLWVFFVIAIMLGILFTGIAYIIYQFSYNSALSKKAKPSVTETESTYKFSINPKNNSGQNGIAEITSLNNQLIVKIYTAGGSFPDSQPVKIQSGNCSNIESVQFNLENSVNGVSSTYLDLSLAELRAKLPMTITIQKSENEANIYTACGEINLEKH